jgi:hypothetical protein
LNIESSLALALIGGAHVKKASSVLWRRRDGFAATERPRNEHLMNRIFRNCEMAAARL